jgi:hypothetical protein
LYDAFSEILALDHTGDLAVTELLNNKKGHVSYAASNGLTLVYAIIVTKNIDTDYKNCT